jgi:hypothetical protein
MLVAPAMVENDKTAYNHGITNSLRSDKYRAP